MDKIKILYRDYQIIPLTMSDVSDSRSNYGWCENEKWKIAINFNVPDIDVADTILHETMHAIVYMMGIDGIFHDSGDKELEEKVVKSLATGLITVMKDNPEYLDEIKRLIEK